jgi:hypothetical protein
MAVHADAVAEVMSVIGIGGRLAGANHRAYGSVDGGSIGLSFNK